MSIRSAAEGAGEIAKEGAAVVKKDPPFGLLLIVILLQGAIMGGAFYFSDRVTPGDLATAIGSSEDRMETKWTAAIDKSMLTHEQRPHNGTARVHELATLSKRIEENTRQIGAVVERLDRLFELLTEKK